MKLDEIIDYVHSKRDEATNTGKGEFANILAEIVSLLQQIETSKLTEAIKPKARATKPTFDESEGANNASEL